MDTALENTNVEFELRYAHGEGHTDLAFDDQAKALITAGVDGEARYWLASDEYQDSESYDVGTPVYALAVSAGKYYVASESNDIKIYTTKEGNYEGSCTRFTTSVYHLDISKDGSLLAAGSGDFTLKVINLEDSSQKSFEGHEAPILSVSLDPQNKFLASSSCDGSIKIWQIEDSKCVYTWTAQHEKSNDFPNSTSLARMSWSPDGSSLALIDKDTVRVFDRHWKETSLFHLDSFTGLSICVFSTDGKRIAVSSSTGIIVVWNMSDTVTPIATFVHEDKGNITSLKWNPSNANELAFCDNSGKFSLVKIINTTTEPAAKKLDNMIDDLYGVIDYDEDFTEEAFVSSQTAAQKSGDETAKKNKLSVHDFAKGDADDGDDVLSSAVKKKKKFVIDDDDDDEEVAPQDFGMDSQPASPHNDQHEGAGNDDIEDKFDDDDAVIDLGALKDKYASIFDDDKEKPDSGDESDDDKESEEKIRIVKQEVNLQCAFQPGSTPVQLEQRFMVWNDTGIVRCYTGEETSIDVEFHDMAVHHSIHINNRENYTIADLSPDALVLANSHVEGTSSSRLFCMNFRTWDMNNKEWKTDMPEDEFIDCLCIGSGFIAVATDQRNIRLFTVSGIQTMVFSIHGPAVALAAQEKSLMLIFHSSAPLPDEQSMSMYVFKVDTRSSVIRRQSMPNPINVALSPKSMLTWMGFTDEGTPCTVDMEGIVRLYKDVIGNTWVPVANLRQTTENKSDHSFVIGMSEIQQQIRCIFCKGARFPQTIPRPMVGVSQFELPFCEKGTTKGKFEEKHVRAKLTNHLMERLLTQEFEVESQLQDNFKQLNESLLRLFAMALNNNCEAMAIEIAHMMPNRVSVEAAIRFAASKRLTALASKLGEIALDKEAELANEEEEEEIQELRYCPSPNKNCSVLTERATVQVDLKPKSLKMTARRGEESSSEDEKDDYKHSKQDSSDDEPEVLRPKAVKLPVNKSLNPFKIAGNANKKRLHTESDEENNSDNELAAGFELFYVEMRDTFEEDNPDASEQELRDTAREGFESLDAEERQEWSEKAESNKSKIRNKQKKIRA